LPLKTHCSRLFRSGRRRASCRGRCQVSICTIC